MLRILFLITVINVALICSCSTNRNDDDNPVQSSSSEMPSSSSVAETPSSSSEALCGGFVEGTEREHYGKLKKQFCDERDGKKYVYVEMGDQTWMAENLNYDASGSFCFNLDPANCDKYGRLYEWATAKTVCPADWHLPSKDEWFKLMVYVAVTDNDNLLGTATRLKAASDWNSDGTDDFGFTALPGGSGDGPLVHTGAGLDGYWWTSNEYDSKKSYTFYIMEGYEDVLDYYDYAGYVFSVRCVKGE